MGKSIVGLVNTWDEAEKVKQALISQGFRNDEINTAFDNAEGQHDEFPIGGDEYADPKARKGGKGARAGIIIGGVIGAVAGFAVSLIPGFLDSISGIWFVFAVLGAGIGAYMGSVVGGVEKLGTEGNAGPEEKPLATGNVVVAVNAKDAQAEQRAMQILRSSGALDVKPRAGVFQDIKGKSSQTNEKLLK